MYGHAFAGGLITAAVCDYRVAVADGARFGLNGVPIGIPMPAVSVRMLAYAWETTSRPAPACSERSSPPLFLIGPGSARMTGQLFSVNGGISVA